MDASSAQQIEFLQAFEEGRKQYRIDQPLRLVDSSGKVVGELYSGCTIWAPSAYDVRGGDASDNLRKVVLFDIPEGYPYTQNVVLNPPPLKAVMIEGSEAPGK